MKNGFEYEAELAALREELAEAYNRNAEQRVELDDLHDLKIYATTPLRERCAERKDLQQRLTAAEQRNAEAVNLLHDASIQLARWVKPTEFPRTGIIAFLSRATESGASE